VSRVRWPWNIAATVALGVVFAGPAAASTLEWAGTLRLDFWFHPVATVGTGVATVDSTGDVLRTLRLAGGLTGTTTIPLTDPHTPPTLVTLIASHRLGTGTLGPFSAGGPLTQSVLPVPGTNRLCILFPGCLNYEPVPLTIGGTKGVGIGGKITPGFYSSGPGLKLSLYAAPWTLGATSVTSVRTPNGGIGTVTAAGFAHGPASATATAHHPGGVIRIVTPTRVDTNIDPPLDRTALMGVLTLRVVPEPGPLLLLGAGAAGLAVLARTRFRA
jgi:hypothetical protein